MTRRLGTAMANVICSVDAGLGSPRRVVGHSRRAIRFAVVVPGGERLKDRPPHGGHRGADGLVVRSGGLHDCADTAVVVPRTHDEHQRVSLRSHEIYGALCPLP